MTDGGRVRRGLAAAGTALVLVGPLLSTAGASYAIESSAIAPQAIKGDTAGRTLGSVPSEVQRYASEPGGLLTRLADLFGPSAAGGGIEFGEDSKAGEVVRAWVFTDAFLGPAATGWVRAGTEPAASAPTESPSSPADADPGADAVQLANLWAVPVLTGDEPVGLATIWINTATAAPDLAEFVPDADAAAALTGLPADARLVRDAAADAWFSMLAGKLIALIPGQSGVVGSIALSDYRAAPVAAPDPQPVDLSGLIGGLAVIAVAALAVIAALVRASRDHALK